MHYDRMSDGWRWLGSVPTWKRKEAAKQWRAQLGEHRHSPACPRCSSYRTWISGETRRCRDCGTRFEIEAGA